MTPYETGSQPRDKSPALYIWTLDQDTGSDGTVPRPARSRTHTGQLQVVQPNVKSESPLKVLPGAARGRVSRVGPRLVVSGPRLVVSGPRLVDSRPGFCGRGGSAGGGRLRTLLASDPGRVFLSDEAAGAASAARGRPLSCRSR